MARRQREEEEEGGENWITSYSDLMTDLLAIFVILFSFSMISGATAASKNADTTESALESAVSYDESAYSEYSEESYTGEISYDESIHRDEFDEVFEIIKKHIEEDGYAELIYIEKGDDYIIFRFKDKVLFYPDSPVMRKESFDILNYMGDMLTNVKTNITGIEIGGHTAETDDPYKGLSPWELSCQRAITVLNFFKENCDLPEEKMIAMGFAHYRPIADNSTEEGRAQNRRVDVKITYHQTNTSNP